jgi:hypothetical protein
MAYSCQKICLQKYSTHQLACPFRESRTQRMRPSEVTKEQPRQKQNPSLCLFLEILCDVYNNTNSNGWS